MDLFADTKQFRGYVPVTINYDIKPLLPSFKHVQDNILPTFLGETLTTQILGYAKLAPLELTITTAKVLELTRAAVAKLAFADHMPFGETQIGNDGITVSANADRKPAFQYQTNTMGSRLLDSGWQAIDSLVTLVDKNVSLFPDWIESPYYPEHQEAIFKTPAEFSRYYPIQDRWLTYWALRPFMRSVEQDWGQDRQLQLETLSSTTDSTKLARANKTLLRALAYQTVIEALPHLSVELNGINVQVNYASQYGQTNYFQPPTSTQLDWVLSKLKDQATLAWDMFDGLLAELNPTISLDTSDGLGLPDSDGHGLIML